MVVAFEVWGLCGFYAGGGEPVLEDGLPEGADVHYGVEGEDGVLGGGDDHAADVGGEVVEVGDFVAGEVLEALVGHVHLAGGTVGGGGFCAAGEWEGVELVPLERDGFGGGGEGVEAADSGEAEDRERLVGWCERRHGVILVWRRWV